MKTLINILIICGLVASCAQQSEMAPIEDAKAIPDHRVTRHKVVKGETLYSIAWRYDLDYRSLASINGIDKEHSIYPGQILELEGAGPRKSYAENQKQKESGSTWQKVKTYVSDQLINTSPKEEIPPKKPNSSESISWQWPIDGRVLKNFDVEKGLNKGIDIRGKLGEPVLAAADGEIVYSGSGLRGYGKLLIVKHSEKFLSAYAHNRVLHVAEGDKVKAGEKIAELGFSGTDSAKLHFEIRFDGQPVDPLKYLPSR